jgi:hypothetical protein
MWQKPYLTGMQAQRGFYGGFRGRVGGDCEGCSEGVVVSSSNGLVGGELRRFLHKRTRAAYKIRRLSYV